MNTNCIFDLVEANLTCALGFLESLVSLLGVELIGNIFATISTASLTGKSFSRPWLLIFSFSMSIMINHQPIFSFNFHETQNRMISTRFTKCWKRRVKYRRQRKRTRRVAQANPPWKFQISMFPTIPIETLAADQWNPWGQCRNSRSRGWRHRRWLTCLVQVRKRSKFLSTFSPLHQHKL